MFSARGARAVAAFAIFWCPRRLDVRCTAAVGMNYIFALASAGDIMAGACQRPLMNAQVRELLAVTRK